MQPVNTLHFNAPEAARKQVLLTDGKINAIETATCVSPVEKVRLLALLCSKRWITELKPHGASDYTLASELLSTLELSWALDNYTQRNGVIVHWIQVGANAAVIQYLQENRARLSVIEAGILYGYPSTATLSCAGLIDVRHKNTTQKTPAERCLGGFFSTAFATNETAYFQLAWSDLRRVSPKLIGQVEKYYDRLK